MNTWKCKLDTRPCPGHRAEEVGVTVLARPCRHQSELSSSKHPPESLGISDSWPTPFSLAAQSEHFLSREYHCLVFRKGPQRIVNCLLRLPARQGGNSSWGQIEPLLWSWVCTLIIRLNRPSCVFTLAYIVFLKWFSRQLKSGDFYSKFQFLVFY